MLRVLSLIAVLFCGVSVGLGTECVLQPGTILRVALPAGSATAPKTAMAFEGDLARPVYNGACQALPQGARVRTVIDRVEKHRGKPVIGWIKRAAGAPGNPPAVTLRSVEVDLPGGGGVPVKAKFVRLASEKHLEAAAKPQHPPARTRVLVLELTEPLPVAAAAAEPRQADTGTIAAGTCVRVDLVTALHTAKNKDGDAFRLRVVEPVMAGGEVMVPEGAVFEGVVARAKRARRPYRAGRLRLNLQSLRLPSGRQFGANATPSAGEFAGATKLDAEGGLTGGARDRKRALLNVGLAYLTGKILDDLIEESAKGAMGVAVAGTAETAARYAGLAAGAFVFLMHRGREVSLPPHTELELTFSRELRISRDGAEVQAETQALRQDH